MGGMFPIITASNEPMSTPASIVVVTLRTSMFSVSACSAPTVMF
jgi:hypothetical protein